MQNYSRLTDFELTMQFSDQSGDAFLTWNKKIEKN